MIKFIYTDKKGIALILVYVLVALLFVTLGILFYTSVQGIKTSQRHSDFLKAFYAAESAVDAAIMNLPAHSLPMPNVAPTNLGGSAQYSATITPFDPTQIPFTKWIIRGIGYVPSSAVTPRSEVEIEAIVEEQTRQNNFFDNAIYSASNLTIRGNSFDINGNVFYNEDNVFNVQHPENIDGTITNGEPVDFINDIDYSLIRTIALNQQAGDGRDHVVDVSNWYSSNLPSGFWYDEVNGIPNVIYVEGAGTLTLSGNQTLGGFIVVVSGDCSVTGTVNLEGCLLVIEDLKISGTVNATGGVWAGDTIDDEGGTKDGAYINGNIYLTYDAGFMSAVEGLNFLNISDIRFISWREIRRQAI